MRIRGRPGSGNRVIATEVEHRGDQPDTDVRFQAVATAAVDPNLTMLGLTVNTAPMSQFRDLNDSPISRTAFFAAVAAGHKLVKVRGSLNLGSSTISWDREAEIED